jgi:phosphate transport system substrate-binding protein
MHGSKGESFVPSLRKLAVLLTALALALTVVACGGDDKEESGGGGGGGSAESETPTGLKGSIAIDGSSTVQPFAESASESFNEENPDVQITVGGAGTGDGFEKFCRGEIAISDASRPIEEDEIKACEKKGIKYTEVQVANDGVTVVTNKATTIDCLTTDQLKDIFGPKAKASSYKDVDPKLPEQEISLFTPGSESGTFDFFTEEINGEEGVQREKGVQTSADDNQIVTGVEGQEGAMGYFGYSFYEQNQEKLNAVAIDGGSGCVKPSAETIQDGSYKPLGRPIFMYVSNAELKKPEVKGFMEYAINNQQQVSELAKIVPMSAEQQDKSLQAVTSAAGS